VALLDLTGLNHLNLFGNQLVGTIPLAIAKLSALEELTLWGNKLHGPIPSTIGTLKELTNLNLGVNQLTGTVPEELVGLKKATCLLLYNNPQLTGILPAFNFSQFRRACSMSADPFVCPLPPGAETCLGSADPHVPRSPPTCVACDGSSANLTINDCSAWQRFTRNPLYTEWAERKCGAKVHTDPCGCIFTRNIFIDCANGRITRIDFYQQAVPSGGFPVALLDLTGLIFLRLRSNRLMGTISSTIGQLTELASLDLAGAYLGGTIPTAIGRLKGLSHFDLLNNQLTGSIPSTIGELTGLNFLNFAQNKLAGSIPGVIGQLTGLTGLDLGDNKLTGPIPSAVGMLKQLAFLRTGNNALTGSIPSTIGQLAKLTSLGLFNNQLTGSMPQEMLQLKQLNSIGLQTNVLTGLPALNFAQFRTCDLSGNPFTCPLPAGTGVCDGGPAIGKRAPPTCIPCTGSSADLLNEDCVAWQVFFHATGGSSWPHNGSEHTSDPCGLQTTWGPGKEHRVTCEIDDGDYRITELRFETAGEWTPKAQPVVASADGVLNPCIVLAHFELLLPLCAFDPQPPGLRGTLPAALSELDSLRTLYLWNNIPEVGGGNLTGAIPAELIKLPKLNYLSLNQNMLTGIVPALNFSKLSGCGDPRGCCFLTTHTVTTQPPTNHFECPLPPDASSCKPDPPICVKLT
jgi:Leucine-rich repeat (LRR) protein